MNLLDIFEGREPHQQAIDRLEQARIAHLEEKMDYYAKHKMAEEFRKAKEERDSYLKVQDECMGYGTLVGEAGIGHDIVNKQEKMARATPPTKAGAVASTVKNAAKWLAGKGGPGKEGPTYEAAQKKNSEEVEEAGGGWALDPKTRLELKRRKNRQKTIAKYAGKDVYANPEWTPDELKALGGPRYKEKNKEIKEGQQLHVGDPIVVTGPNEFEGKTGEIYEFSPSGSFVIVDLYNHGKHSMHLSDITYNEYADQEADEEDDWYDDEVDEAYGPYGVKSASDIKRIERAKEREKKDVGMYRKQKPSVKQKYIDQNIAFARTVDEGWSDAIVAQRTGRPRTPYSVYIKGKKWKDFENDDHAEAVANKLRAKFKAEGRDPSVITIAPTDYDKMGEAISKKDLLSKVAKDLNSDEFKNTPVDPNKSFTRGDHWQGAKPGDYGYTGYQGHGMPTDKAERNRIRADKKKGVAEGENQEYTVRVVDEEGSGYTVKVTATSEQGALHKAIVKVRNSGARPEHARVIRQGVAEADETSWRVRVTLDPRDDMNKGRGAQVKTMTVSALDKDSAAKKVRSYFMKNGWAVTDIEFVDGIAEAETDYSKRRQRERDVDAGKPVAKQRQSKMTDYQKKRAQQKKELELGEDSSTSSEDAERAILNRIMVANTDLLKQFGPQKVMQAVEEVAYNVGDLDEIGTSDVSAWVNEVQRILGA